MRLASLLAALVAGIVCALLVGCGIDTKQAGTPTVGPPSDTTRTAPASPATQRLPKRPNGVVAAEGPSQGSLTPLAIQGVQGVRVNFATVSENQGFQDLCAGRIDVLDTARTITPSEARLCRHNGVFLADNPIQVASDAIVVATRNESDVGGDCLRLSTVNDIFRAGSQIDNWSQVGFFDIPLRVTGREDSSPLFQSFAQTVLGVPANGSLADVRSDYIVHTSDDGVRNEVTSAARTTAVLDRYGPRLRQLRFNRQIALQAAIDNAIRRAQARVLAQIDRENRQRAAQLVVLTPTQKALIARNNLRRIRAATADAAARAQATFSYPQLTFLQQHVRRLLRNAFQRGTVGFFRFSYYELYENLLRPMEIWDPALSRRILSLAKGVTVVPGTPTATTTTSTTTTSTSTTTTSTSTSSGNVVVDPDTTPWCVFPSQTTITNGSYPLAKRMFLYVSKTNIRRDEVRTFLRSYLASAQRLATSNRYVPIDDTTLAADESLIDNNGVYVPPEATTTISTSTVAGTAAPPQAQNVPGVAGGETTPATTTTTTTTTPTTTSP